MSVEHLSVTLRTSGERLHVLNDLSYRVQRGQTVGIVGESGCGKSMSALAILGLLPPNAQITGGQIYFEGVETSGFSQEQYRTHLRGRKISIIFQDALVALNPVFTIGAQIAEALQIRHPEWKTAEVREQSLDLLAQVRIANPLRLLKEYPHRLSGGMRQRVMIAMALAAQPDLLIADEPTTAVDVTIQAQILDLMQQLQQDHQTSILLITHDMGVVSEMCDEVHVMYGGQIIESGPADTLFARRCHPYTAGLLNALPMEKNKSTPLANIPGSVTLWQEAPHHCLFAPRCPLAEGQCWQSLPPLQEHTPGLQTACLKAKQVPASSLFTTDHQQALISRGTHG